MSNTERVAAFSSSWVGRPVHQIATEMTSVVLESRRFPDPYYFFVDASSSKLISPMTGKPVEDSMEKEGLVESREYIAFSRIEQFSLSSSEGISLWISPPYDGKYPTSKLIISQIVEEEGSKQLLNRAIVTDWSMEESLSVASTFSLLSTEGRRDFESAEDLRAIPLFVLPEQFEPLQFLFRRYLGETSRELIDTGEDFQEQQRVYTELYPVAVALSESPTASLDSVSSLMGTSSLSCPPTQISKKRSPFEVFGGVRLLCCTCPLCGHSVEASIFGGYIHCPDCGARREWKDAV